jgi:hypothetical protein
MSSYDDLSFLPEAALFAAGVEKPAVLPGALWLSNKQQVPPLRYAPVGMTNGEK